MNKEISFDKIPEKPITPIIDVGIEKMRDESIRKLEKTQIDKQVRAEAGLTEIPKEPESIPKELPKLVFKLGAKVISCEKFNLDDDEAKVMAKHLSILCGALSSKWYSLIIVIIIIISKVTECFSGLKNMFKRGKKDKNETVEIREQGRPIDLEIGKGKIYE